MKGDGYLVAFLLFILGAALGWTMKESEDAFAMMEIQVANSKLRKESSSCTATLEQTWAQMRSLSAEASRCRQSPPRLTP